MPEHTFRATVWEHSPGDPSSWHFVTLPSDLADDIAVQAGPRTGFGSVRVRASIGATSWQTSLFPESASGSFVLPIKKEVRSAEQLEAGTSCLVVIEVA